MRLEYVSLSLGYRLFQQLHGFQAVSTSIWNGIDNLGWNNALTCIIIIIIIVIIIFIIIINQES